MYKGSKHDLELFKENLNSIPKGAFILGDKGDQGIYTIYEKALFH